MSFFSELKRRNVLRVAAAYVVVAWVVVQAAVTLREIFPTTPIWIGQALLVFLILGAVPVLSFSWFYELTPEGFKRDEDISGDRAYEDESGRKLIYLTLTFVFIGVAMFSWSRIGQKAAEEPAVPVKEFIPNSVAVLPFTNMSADPENEYFSDGLTETLLHMLAQVKDLKVAARTSSFAFKGQGKDIREIALALGVAHVLEGSVQRVGDRVRVTAQLIRAEDGFHVWSENYDQLLTDIFSIQDEIASQVGITLLASLLNPADIMRPEGVDTNNFKAYDLYLRARAEINIASFDALKKAETYLQAAILEDPKFLDAKAEMAALVITQADTGMRTYAEAIGRSHELIGEVLASDPNHVRARALELLIRANKAVGAGDRNIWEEIEPEIRSLVAVAPDDIESRLMLSVFVSRWGNPEEAVAILKDALEVDPLNAFMYERLAGVYARIGDLGAARDAMVRSLEIEPEAPNAWAILADISLHLGDGVAAIDGFLRAQSLDALDPELPEVTAQFLYLIGLSEEADEFHQRVLAIASESEAAKNLNLLQALSLNDMDGAVQLARDIIADGWPPERFRAWRHAWQVLMFTSVRRGEEKEDIAYLDKYLPEFSNLDNLEVDGNILGMRMNSVDVLSAVKAKVELTTFRDRARARFLETNSPGDIWPHIELDWEIFQGNMDTAMELALDKVFTKPVTEIKLWRLRFARPFMSEFMSDPQIQRALRRWEDEEERLRSEVLDYLANRR